MSYLTRFIVIGMNDRFYSDWLGAGPIGPQLREREKETGKSGNPPFKSEVSFGQICHVTHHSPIAPLYSRSRTKYMKLFILLLCVTYMY
jgi:hypothetical protein